MSTTPFQEKQTAVAVLGTIRASSWKGLFACPLSWYYQNVEKLRSPSAGIAQLGTAIHAGTALFDGPRLYGNEISVEEAVEGAIAVLHTQDEEVSWDSLAEFKAAEIACIKVVTKYCNEVAPHVVYSAVEVRCEDLIIQTDYGPIRTTGTIDRVRLRDDGSENVRDLKSGKQAAVYNDAREAVATIGAHHLQVGIYTFMAEQELKKPLDALAEITGMSTGKETIIATSEIKDVRTALLGTERSPGMINIAAKILKDGVFPANPSSSMCSEKYCTGWNKCQYRNQ